MLVQRALWAGERITAGQPCLVQAFELAHVTPQERVALL